MPNSCRLSLILLAIFVNFTFIKNYLQAYFCVVLYISQICNGSSSSITLIAGENGTITFRGNKHNITLDNGAPVAGTGTANTIFFGGSPLGAELNFTIGSGGTIEFYDPIASNNDAKVAVNINDGVRSFPTLPMGTVTLNGKDYIDEDDINRYYDITNDTKVYAGAFGLANNIIYGRNGGNSTVDISKDATLFSSNTLGRNDINNIINAYITNYGSLYFLNNVNNTYNILSVNAYAGESDIYFNFNSDDGASDILAVENGAFGNHIVSATGIGAGTLLIIPDVITVGKTSGAETFTGGGSAGLYNYNLEQNIAGNWDLVRRGFNDTSDITLTSIASLHIGWFTQLDDLTHRLGMVRIEDYVDNDSSFWVRSFVGQVDSKFKSVNNINFKEYQYGADMGYDMTVKRRGSWTSLFGLFGGYMRGDRSFNDIASSNGYTTSIYGGIYGTFVSDSGMYVDIVSKAQNFRSKLNLANNSASFKALGFGTSIEAGKPFDVGSGVFIEPRVQAAVLSLEGENIAFGSGFDVHRDAATIYRFIGAVKLGQTVNIGNNKPFTYYLTLGVEKETSTGGKVRSGDDVFNVDTDGIRTITGFGLVYNSSRTSQAHFDIETAFGDKYKRPWTVNVGYRVQF